MDLQYDTGFATATLIEFGPAFTQQQSGTIGDGTGLVDDLGGVTLRTDVGDDEFALLGRVRFVPSSNVTAIEKLPSPVEFDVT